LGFNWDIGNRSGIKCWNGLHLQEKDSQQLQELSMHA